MKKLISIILAIIMVMSAVPLAFAEEIEISFNEVLTIVAPSYGYEHEEYTYIKFVPENYASLMFKSITDGEYDTVCYLYDSEMNELDYNDDYKGLDFCISYNFAEGETYYFAVASYDGPVDIKVTLVCGHEYVDGVCTKCADVCTHEVGSVNCPVACNCGLVFEGIEMVEGEEHLIDFEAIDNEDGWGKFIPEESGVYCFESVYGEDAHDCNGTLYDEDYNELSYNDDYDETLMFRIFYYLTAGETYYISCHGYYEDASNTIKVERVKHTADDGSVHTDLSVCEATDSTCSTPGHSEGIYCNECQSVIMGCEEYGLDPYYHIDEDINGICDECGKELFIICKHICHSANPFLAFIWRIINTINRLLGIGLECECGIYHYITDEIIPN